MLEPNRPLAKASLLTRASKLCGEKDLRSKRAHIMKRISNGTADIKGAQQIVLNYTVWSGVKCVLWAIDRHSMAQYITILGTTPAWKIKRRGQAAELQGAFGLAMFDAVPGGGEEEIHCIYITNTHITHAFVICHITIHIQIFNVFVDTWDIYTIYSRRLAFSWQ